jgi:hypothetical protein
MGIDTSFNSTLFAAVESKLAWYESTGFPQLHDDYRSFRTVLCNLIGLLEKKGLIQPDPYKSDKKISTIAVPPDGPFLDNERSMVMGARLSEYESMIDFICNIHKFTISNTTMNQIKIFLGINSYINWSSVVPTSQKPNTKALAEIVTSIKMGSDRLATNMVTDCIQQSTKIINKINGMLKDITDFQKELYKVEIRKSIFMSSQFPVDKISTASDCAIQVRKLFPVLMGKTPYYPELVDEVSEEEFGSGKERLQQALLLKLAVEDNKKEKKKAVINTKEMLFEAIKTLGALPPQLEIVLSKIEENHEIILDEKRTFWEKIKELFRKAFGIKEKPFTYELTIVEPLTQSKRKEEIDYNQFHTDLVRRTRVYKAFSARKAPGFLKLENQEESVIFEYLAKQLSECHHILVQLTAFNDYFKTSCLPEDRLKMKTIQMELTAIKNTLVRTNQRKAEYTSVIEEEEQLKKLGISNV